MTILSKDFTCNIVWLDNFDVFKFRINIIGAPILKVGYEEEVPEDLIN